jgi:hypothetical protein
MLPAYKSVVEPPAHVEVAKVPDAFTITQGLPAEPRAGIWIPHVPKEGRNAETDPAGVGYHVSASAMAFTIPKTMKQVNKKNIENLIVFLCI